MTANSLRFHELQEAIRHNKATELVQSRDVSEKSRHNLVSEVETQRSNVAKEGETARANRAREAIDTGHLLEGKRHNIESERLTAILNNANIRINERKQNEVERYNQMQEYFTQLGLDETQRHNLATEGAQLISARASAAQAQAARTNATTNARHQAMLNDQWLQQRPYAAKQYSANLSNTKAATSEKKSNVKVNDSIIDLNKLTGLYTDQKTQSELYNTQYMYEKAGNEGLKPVQKTTDQMIGIVDAFIPF